MSDEDTVIETAPALDFTKKYLPFEDLEG